MVSSANVAAFLLLASTAVVLAQSNSYIPTSGPGLNTGYDHRAAMFLAVFSQPGAEDRYPCSDQTATLYPALGQVMANTSACVNADTITSPAGVTCVQRFNDTDRLDFHDWNCPILGYGRENCAGPSQSVPWSSGNNSWTVPGGVGLVSFQIACTPAAH